MDTPTTSTPALSRRAALRTGALGAAATFFLAACGEDSPTGLSGGAPPTTLVEPVVPTTRPSQAALDEDVVQRSTLASLEELVATVYDNQGLRITDGELAAVASRFADDHRTAARAIRGLGETNELASSPNEFIKVSLVDPRTDTLTDETAIRAFMADLESALAATYINAVGVITEVDERQEMMYLGAAAARRIGVLAPGAAGAPEEALFSLLDLVPADAYIGREEDLGG